MNDRGAEITEEQSLCRGLSGDQLAQAGPPPAEKPAREIGVDLAVSRHTDVGAIPERSSRGRVEPGLFVFMGRASAGASQEDTCYSRRELIAGGAAAHMAAGSPASAQRDATTVLSSLPFGRF